MEQITMKVPNDFCDSIAIANGWTPKIIETKSKIKNVSSVEEGNEFVRNLKENQKFIKSEGIESPEGEKHFSVFYKEQKEVANISKKLFAKESVKKLAMEKYSEAKSGLAIAPLLKEAEKVRKKAEEDAVSAEITVE